MSVADFLARFGLWRRRRVERQTRRALEPTPAPSEPGADERTATDRYRQRGLLDAQTLFDAPAERSRRRHRAEDVRCDPLVAELVQELWAAFFAGFREDERAFELARFEEEAAAVQERLDALGGEEQPDLTTCRQMLYLLAGFLRERSAAWDRRLNAVLAEACEAKRELNVVQLSTSWQADELDYCRELLTRSIRQRDVHVPRSPDGAPPLVSELVCLLLGITRAPPRPRSHRGRVPGSAPEAPAIEPFAGEPTPPAGAAAADRRDAAEVRRALTETLDGGPTLGRLVRLLDDEALARRLCELVEEHRRHRDILSRIGLLPPSAAAR